MQREPGFLEQYWPWVLAGVAVILVQSGFIIALVMQKRRRLAAERELSDKQQQLTHLTRVSALGQLTGTLTHEISQPLATILTSAEAAQLHTTGKEATEELRPLLENIIASAQRGAALLQRLRAMMRREKNPWEPFDLNDLARDTLGLMHSELTRRDIKASFLLSPGPLPVNGDAVQIQQILINLITNAFDAMAGRPASWRRIEIATSRLPSGEAELAVTDTGLGLGGGDMERVFEPFYTTKPEGLGLGMSICRRIAEDHGGSMHMRPAAECGMTATLLLPFLSTASPT